MATKIRLQRGGRKSYAFYRIVIADVRAPRDGKFTEKIGTKELEAEKKMNEAIAKKVADKKAAAAAAQAEAEAAKAAEEAPAEEAPAEA